MAGTEITETDKSVPRGFVQDTVNLFGERIVGVKPERKKTQMQIPLNLPSKEGELHLLKKEITQFEAMRNNSEIAKVRAEYALSNSREKVEDLTLQIKKSKVNAESNKLKFQGARFRKEPELGVNKGNDEVLRELQIVKEELMKLKFDIERVLEEKSEAEKRTEDSIAKAESGPTSLESLREEIEQVMEEQGLVELATMEAVNEFEEIEARREAEYTRFSKTIETNRKNIKYLNQEVKFAKDLELKLAVTNSDLEVLQNEVKFVKEMEKINSETKPQNSPEKLSFLVEEISKTIEEESATSSLLHSATTELKAAKKELQSIKEEGFQFMASMDAIRNEIKHVSKETERFKNLEAKEKYLVHDLNSKLKRTKPKLEAATAAEGNANAILANLSATLKQLETDKLAAVKEKEAIDKENLSLKLEIQKKESEAYLAEERLQDTLQELEVVKTAETVALDTLKSLTAKTMKARAASSLHSSIITISNFEYEYLSRRANGADEIADKKVVAAQAWIEAIKAGEKEMIMKTEIHQREIRELKRAEEKEIHGIEKSLEAKEAVENELKKWRQKKDQIEIKNLQLEVASPRKPMKEKKSPSFLKRTKLARRPPSPGTPHITCSPSISVNKKKKKKMVIPNLGKLLNNKKSEKKAWKQDGNARFGEVY